MNIAEKIRNYQNNVIDKKEQSLIFLDLADDIINDFQYRLENKTYLLIPDQRRELREMAYEYSLYTGKTIPTSLTLNMLKIMNKFNEVAQKLGFTVITKMSDYHNDGQLFDLLGTESINKGLIKEEYTNFNDVKIPLTLSVDDYSKRIFFPVVFKNSTANRGEDKYLIENKEQLEKILAVFELPESKTINLKNEFVVQEYIQSFEGINSSIRVYTSCTGDILSSLFLVSTGKPIKKRVKNLGIGVFNPCEYLIDSNSAYYLNSKNIISNVAGGGGIIPLNADITNLKAAEEIILTFHDINVETLELPNTVIEQCKKIATSWGSEKGIVLGIDFIYNSLDNSWYYLETNRNPSVEGYKRFMNLNGYLKKDIKSLMQLDSLTSIVENIITKDMTTEKTRTK